MTIVETTRTRMTTVANTGIRMSTTITLVCTNPLHLESLNDELMNPGKYSERDMPDYSNRNFSERGFTIGIGG
jgi:hypothetical protein